MPDETARAAKPSLTLTRRIKASPQKIFAAWIDPAQMMHWFCPEGGQFISAETDPRVGGRYRIVMRTPDGATHDVSGIYREVADGEKLCFTWAWISTPERESLVTVTLKPDGDATLLTLLHERFFDEAARDSHNGGWTVLLGKLDRIFG
jgi:uncharacterized protein YndB with AHSA1/START domain